MAFTEAEAVEGSGRMARVLGEGWMAAPLACGMVERTAHYPSAVCGEVRLIQTSARPVTYRAQVEMSAPGSSPGEAATGLLTRLSRTLRAMQQSERG